MNEINPDHLKYMPQSPGSEEPKEPLPSEEVVIVEEEIEVAPVENKTEVEEPPLENEREEEEVSEPLSFFNEGWISCVYALLSPLFVPTVATLFIFFFSILALVAPGAVLPYSLTVFGAICVIPLLVIFVLQKIGVISTFRMEDKSERLIPYVIYFLAMGSMAIFFVCKGAAPWLWTIFCGGAAVALVNFALNFKLRVSTHCSAMAGLLAVLLVIQSHGMPWLSLFWWLVGVAFLTGFAGTVAIGRDRHTIWEVIVGYATGFLGIILFSLIN